MSLNKKMRRIIAAAAAAAVLIGVGAYAAAAVGNSGSKQAGDLVTLGDYSTSEVSSIRHTQYAPSSETVQSSYTVEGYTLRLESDVLQVWVQNGTSRLRIVDRRSGYVWGCCVDEKPDGLNKTWYARASALVAIEYYDEEGSEKNAASESSNVELDYEWHDDYFLCAVDMTQQQIRLTVKVALEGDSLRVSVVEDSFEEYGLCKLKSLYFMPFLGSTLSDEVDGYFFVPDGCGALLRFAKPSDYNSALEGRIYGPDAGIDSLNTAASLLASRSDDYLTEENVMTLPLYGIVHGEDQNAVLAIVDGGVEQAYIKASVAGVITDYNWLTARFEYRTSYMKPVNKAGTGVYTAQENANDIAPAVEYVFLTGEDANYSSMAVYYREYLQENGSLPETQAQEQIPLWLSVLGAEIKKGVLFNTVSMLTTVEDGRNITAQVQAAGIHNLQACYYGWQKGGLNGSDYGQTGLYGRLGTTAQLDAWLRAVKDSGGSLRLYYNLGRANEDQLSIRSEAALNVSSSYVRYSVANDTLMYPDSYVVKADLVALTLQKLQKKWPEYSLALDNVGDSPYSDYTRGQKMTRLQTMQTMTQMLADADHSVAVFRPSVYQWLYVSDYLDMPLTNSQYLFETDTVPFLQIVLKGAMNCYSPYINLGYYSDSALLKMVEYGVYPSFIVAQAESYELEDTPLEDMFSVNYGDWSDKIVRIYNFMSGALDAVEGQVITEHRMMATGVARVTYDGGTCIYVNYNNEAVTVDGVTVPAMSYLVGGGDA